MLYISHNYNKIISNYYKIGIPSSIIIGFFILYLLFFVGEKHPHFDTPSAAIVSTIAVIPIVLLLIVFPIVFVLLSHHLKNKILIGYYDLNSEQLVYITPRKTILRKMPWKNIRIIYYPDMGGTKFEIKWYGDWAGSLIYICGEKVINTRALDTKTAYRILVHYLRRIREHPEDFKATIQHRAEPDDWKKEDAIKKSLKKNDPSIWDNFLDEWWRGREKGREYWLKTPIERILRDIHCPYTVEELENPSEDEIVEIDDSKLKEVIC